MRLSGGNVLRSIAVTGLLLAGAPLHAEYLHIQMRVYGLDCELCARGVSASIQRLNGVNSVDISLRSGNVTIELKPGNTFKMSDLRKRIRENGFRAVDATVTAVGKFNGSKFVVIGSGESYEVSISDPKTDAPVQETFEVR